MRNTCRLYQSEAKFSHNLSKNLLFISTYNTIVIAFFFFLWGGRIYVAICHWNSWLNNGCWMGFEGNIMNLISLWQCFRSIIIIIIMSRYQHGYPWPSLATPPDRPLLPADPQGYIPYQHRAAVCKFELVVLPLHVHVKRFTGVHHFWARPYFSSSVSLSIQDVVTPSCVALSR